MAGVSEKPDEEGSKLEEAVLKENERGGLSGHLRGSDKTNRRCTLFFESHGF